MRPPWSCPQHARVLFFEKHGRVLDREKDRNVSKKERKKDR
jgi:hypothetical protein